MELLERLQAALQERYLVESVLGSGGTATVFSASDRNTGASVALKVLRPELAAALGTARFLHEIAIARSLTHPNIVPCLDSGEADGLPFYAMPRIPGESLAARIRRTGPLPVDEAVAITIAVARALQYSHDRGVIHRDIKPANVLLDGSRVLVADFGLARAIERSADERALTSSGVTVGTPTYMSPEQASGIGPLDGRTDLYSLGCMAYEMLAGDPPFVASTTVALLARHTSATATSLRAIRSTVPEWLDTAVLKALQKLPGDRPQSPNEFIALLEGRANRQDQVRVGAPNRRRRVLIGVGAIVLAALAFATFDRDPGPIDGHRFVVLPIQAGNDVPTAAGGRRPLAEAVGQWNDVSVVDSATVTKALAGKAVTAEGAAALAERLGAGFAVGGQATAVGDSIEIELFAADARPPISTLGRLAGRVPRSLSGFDALVGSLTAGLLAGATTAPISWPRTTSLEALRKYAVGQNLLNEWDLEQADTALAEAVRLDPNMGAAWLGLAQARFWVEQAPSTWQFAAARAIAVNLSHSADRATAEGLVAISRLDYQSGCRRLREAALADSSDGRRWYSLATCLRLDPIVVRDRHSRTGWRFRSSYAEAVSDYRRAMVLLPAIHRGFRQGSFQRVRDILFTGSARSRGGRLVAGGPIVMAAMAEWQGDSLVFFPISLDQFSSAKTAVPKSNWDAIVRQRQLFRDLASSWLTAFPDSPAALEAVAVALDLMGDPAAPQLAARARLASRTAADSLRTASAEFWLRLKHSLPSDTASLRRVRLLGESLLDRAAPGSDAALLAPIAAVLGRSSAAAGWYAGERLGSPTVGDLGAVGPAVLIYAGAGGPVDSLVRYATLVERLIDGAVLGSDQQAARRDWLARPAVYWFPRPLPSPFARIGRGVDALLDAQRAVLAGDTAGALRYVHDRTSQRETLRPQEQSLDALLPEARLLVALGRERAAVDWLEATLSNIRWVSVQELANLTNAVSLVPAMALLGRLDTKGSDSAGVAWGRAAGVLNPLQ